MATFQIIQMKTLIFVKYVVPKFEYLTKNYDL